MTTTTTPSTQESSTLPSRVSTWTIIAQVVGYVIVTFGGILTIYAQQHVETLWPGVAISAMGVVLAAATHHGYVKGQTLTQNAIVNSLLTLGGPAAYAFLAVLVSKGTIPDALKAGMNQAFTGEVLDGTAAGPFPPPVAPLLPQSPQVVTVAAPTSPR